MVPRFSAEEVKKVLGSFAVARAETAIHGRPNDGGRPPLRNAKNG